MVMRKVSHKLLGTAAEVWEIFTLQWTSDNFNSKDANQTLLSK